MNRIWIGFGSLGWSAIALLSLVPAEARPHSGAGGVAEHFLAYLMVGTCLSLGLTMKQRVPVLILLVASAGLFELLQRHIPGRSGDLEGLVSAAAGVIIGAIAVWAISKKKEQ